IEVRLHVRAHQRVRPEAWVRRGQEVRDVVGVGVPPGAGVGECRAVAGLRRLQHLDGDGDVVVQQRGEPVAGRLAVEGFDGVADLHLVAQQAGGGGREAVGAVREGDDRQPRPGDVVLPELAHLVVEGHLYRRARGGYRGVVVVLGGCRGRVGRAGTGTD